MVFLLVCILCSILAISPPVFSLEIQRIPSTGSPPSKRQLSSIVHDPVDNTLYLYGGLEENGEPLDEMWSFNLDSNSWEQIFTPSVVTPGKRFMAHLHFIASQRAILLYGGSGPRGAVSDLWKFDIVTRMVRFMQWSYVETRGVIPIPSMHPYITEYSDSSKRYLAVIAGFTRFGILNKMYSLDLETFTWSEIAVSGPGPDLCKLGTIAFFEDTFYVFEPVEFNSPRMKMMKLSLKDKVWERIEVGGFIENVVVDLNSVAYGGYIFLMPGVDHEHFEDTQDAFKLKIEDIRAGVIQLEAAKMPKNLYIPTRSNYARIMVNEALYMFGGLAYEGLLNELVKVEFCNDNLANEALKFEILSKDIVMPPARMEHAMEIFDEKLYIFAGTAKNEVLLNDMWVFNLKAEVWKELMISSHVPSPRRNFSHIKIGNTMFIFGGQGESGLLNDIYSFKFETLSWRQFNTETSINSPSARKGACMSASDDIIFIFGGITAGGYTNELWKFDPRTGNFELLNALGDLPPASMNSGCDTVYTENGEIIFRVYLGSTRGSAPLSTVYEYTLSTHTWAALDDRRYQIFARDKAAVLLMGNDLLIVGGENWGYSIKKNAYHYDITSKVATNIGRLPTGIYSAGQAYYKDTLYLHGGGSSSVDISIPEPTTDLFLLKLNSQSNLGKNDWPCSKGTYYDNGECIICDRGSYSDKLGQFHCKLCAPGTYSDLEGAESVNQCFLCPEGTYNSEEGQPFCLECSMGSTCPIGSAKQSPELHHCEINGTGSDQPGMHESLNYEVDLMVKYTGIAVSLIILILMILLTISGRLVRYIRALDLYMHNHNYTINSPMYLKKNIIGGLFSIILIILAAMIITHGVASYAVDNIQEVKTLVPMVTLEEEYKEVSFIQFKAEEIEFQYCLRGYGGKCEYREGFTEHLEIVKENIYGRIEDITMRRHLTDCVVSFKCSDCEILYSSRIQINLLEDLSFADQILLNITSSSSIPDETSSVLSQLSADVYTVFRGLDPSKFTFLMTPSLYISDTRFQSTKNTGYHITNTDKPVSGSVVNIPDISYSKGLSLEILLVKDDSVLLVEISEKESLLYVSVKYLSYVVGCFGAIGFVLRLFERCGKPIYKYIKNKTDIMVHSRNAHILKDQFNIEKKPQGVNIGEISPMGIEISLSSFKYNNATSDISMRQLMHKYSISTNSSHSLESFATIRRSSTHTRSNQILPI